MVSNLLLFGSKVDRKDFKSYLTRTISQKIFMGLIKIVKTYEGEMIETSF